MTMDALKKITSGQNLTSAEAQETMDAIMAGKFTDSQAGGLLIALKMKGETIEEITGFAKSMRNNAIKISPKVPRLVDTCGTGGDALGTFNISTSAAIIACACGASVAKHGNRSASGSSGSADVMEALGVKMLEPAKVEKCIESTGFGFMFATLFHPAMKNVAHVRKELGVRTIFNLLGPLTNPAGAQTQLAGVFDKVAAQKIANVLMSLGTEHALVVNSQGMDEIGLGKTDIYEVRNGRLDTYTLDAKELGFSVKEIPKAASSMESAQIIRDVLNGKQGAARDVSIINAAAALYVSGKAKSIQSGIAVAQNAIDSGKARDKLAQIAEFTGE
ncbi:MAG TPA: anthranilate phosphoribosyltransferase [Candidatus Micrarchaeota archaeon]|nr:anthranilate phosphoribosyltransferase [Candidatus Micrarchaeota archaeon]